MIIRCKVVIADDSFVNTKLGIDLELSKKLKAAAQSTGYIDEYNEPSLKATPYEILDLFDSSL